MRRTRLTRPRRWAALVAVSRLASGLTACLAWLWVAGPVSASLVDDLREAWRWAEFDTSSGLPSAQIRAIAETDDGTPWVGTAAGLAWYDGHLWTAVGSESGVPAGRVAALACGPGELVHAIVDHELYQGSAGRPFRHVALPSGKQRGPRRHLVPLLDGRLLCIADYRAFLVEDGRVRPFELPPGPAGDHVYGAWRARSGRVLVAARGGLFAQHATGWTPRLRAPREGSLWVTSAIELPDGGGFASVLHPGEMRGIWSWSATSPARREDSTGYSMAKFWDAHPDRGVLVVHDSGAVRLRNADGAWEALSHPPSQFTAGVSALRFRRDGDLWLGTATGLALHRASSRRWERLEHPFGDMRNTLHDLALMRDGSLWMATPQGLVVRRPDGSLETTPEIAGRMIRGLTTVAEDSEGHGWIASGGTFEGAFRWDGRSWRHFGAEDGLDAPRVHRIRTDRSGRLWFLAVGEQPGLGEPGAFVLEDDRFRRVRPPGAHYMQRTYAIAEDLQGDHWLGTAGGLCRLRRGEWRCWTEELAERGETSARVFAIAAGSDGRIWFARGTHGLGWIDESDEVQVLTAEDGLLHDEIWDLAFDDGGRLWVSTLGGLAAFSDGSWSSFGTEQGLPLARTWPVLPVGGQVYVGTIGRGLAVLDRHEEDDPAPRLVTSPAIVEGRTALLRWAAFAPWGSQPSTRIETRHRIDGGPWSPWDRRREITLTGLSSGAHVAEFEAKGLFGRKGRGRIAFDKPGPAYLTPGFLLPVGFLAFGLAGVAIHGYRRRRAQDEVLRANETRFREIFETASDPIFTADMDARLTSVNVATERLTGYTRDEIIGLYIGELLEPASAARAAESLARKLAGEELTRYEVQLRTKTGELRWFDVSTTLQKHQGKPTGIHGTARDITERKRNEEERLALEEQARHGQKLESLGVLAGGIAHDFNNILVAIVGSASLLRNSEGLSGNALRALERIESASARATDLTRVMLAYSGRARFEIGPLDLSALVREMTSLLEASIPKKVEMSLNLAEDLPPVDADRAQLQQVVMNLITNAADAIGDRPGRISVVTGHGRTGPLPGAYLDSDLPRSSSVWIEVADDGAGMDQEVRQRIFDPFFTTKASGRGLGLAAVLGIVRAHRGTLTLSSTPGIGTSFRILFPASATALADREHEREGLSSRNERLAEATVLVVDDEERVRQVAREMLLVAGCRVLIAEDGEEALEVFRAHASDIDLVLLDLQMPRMGGDEAFDELRTIDPELPVILTSGYSEHEGLARVVARGSAGFLAKPYKIEDLHAAAAVALSRRGRPAETGGGSGE